jgi:hypothetical protein
MNNNDICRWPACSCKATGVYCSKKGKKAKEPKPLKRTPIKKVSDKGKIKKIAKKELVQTDMAFYLQSVWDIRPHICQVTNTHIHDPRIQNFHHILEKAQFPEYRHKEWNILLVSWETHDKIHRNIDNVPKVKELQAKLMQMHDNGELATMDDIDILIKVFN